MEFPGKAEIKEQLFSAQYEVIDTNGTLDICPIKIEKAPVVKTIPVEAEGEDLDGIPISVLLFTRDGLVYMLEVLRMDGEKVKQLPEASTFELIVLAP